MQSAQRAQRAEQAQQPWSQFQVQRGLPACPMCGLIGGPEPPAALLSRPPACPDAGTRISRAPNPTGAAVTGVQLRMPTTHP